MNLLEILALPPPGLSLSPPSASPQLCLHLLSCLLPNPELWASIILNFLFIPLTPPPKPCYCLFRHLGSCCALCRRLPSSPPSLIVAYTAQYRLSSGINSLGFQEGEPNVPPLAVTGLCPQHIALKQRVHVPISLWTVVSSRTRSHAVFIFPYPLFTPESGIWQVLC